MFHFPSPPTLTLESLTNEASWGKTLRSTGWACGLSTSTQIPSNTATRTEGHDMSKANSPIKSKKREGWRKGKHVIICHAAQHLFFETTVMFQIQIQMPLSCCCELLCGWVICLLLTWPVSFETSHAVVVAGISSQYKFRSVATPPTAATLTSGQLSTRLLRNRSNWQLRVSSISSGPASGSYTKHSWHRVDKAVRNHENIWWWWWFQNLGMEPKCDGCKGMEPKVWIQQDFQGGSSDAYTLQQHPLERLSDDRGDG